MPFGIRTALTSLPVALHHLLVYLNLKLNPRLLKEYRCPDCHKLLAKGQLVHKDSMLEVKCRGCGTICIFHGEAMEIIEMRSKLLKEGKIPDPDASLETPSAKQIT